MAVSYDYGWADEHDLLVTQPYLAGSVMRVVRPDAGAGETAAVVTGTYLENEVRLKYPALRTAGYATYTDCMPKNSGCPFTVGRPRIADLSGTSSL